VIRPIHVTWRDACKYTGPIDEDALSDDPGLLMNSVGWLLRETDTFVTLAMTRVGEGQFYEILEIPKSWIVKRKRL